MAKFRKQNLLDMFTSNHLSTTTTHSALLTIWCFFCIVYGGNGKNPHWNYDINYNCVQCHRRTSYHS